jgi:PREDICTED: similar to futsch CG3064-PB
MKIVLVLLIIVFCVLGFFFFIWYISKQETHKPIEEVKESDKSEAEFTKQRQQVYHQQEKTEVKRIEILKTENRGKLFERAIERKRTAYKDDDEEYQNRLQGLKGKEKQEEVSPIQPMGMPEPEEEPVPSTPITTNEDTPEPEKEEKTNIDWNDWEEQKQPLRPSPLQQQSDFLKRKKEVEIKEQDRKMEIQTLRAEILLEVENLKKRRLALIEIPS